MASKDKSEQSSIKLTSSQECDGLEAAINSKSGALEALSVKDKWLAEKEMKAAYKLVFQEKVPTRRGRQIQRNGPMSANAVQEELGKEMQETYDYLVEAQKFLSAGKRPHNFDDDLLRHLWETAHITNVIGCPIETKQLALVHSFIEHRARGLFEARRFLGKVREGLGGKLADNLNAFTDHHGILIDAVEYRIKKTGNYNGGKKTKRLSWEKILDKEGRPNEDARLVVASALEKTVDLSPTSNKRLLPTELTGGINTYKEARAILHRSYVERLYASERSSLEKSYEKGEAYYNPLLVVKAVCLIDRLRTAENRLDIEKATRETLDFLPRFDMMRIVLKNSGVFDNRLAFVNSALKAELLSELDQRTLEAKGRREQTTFAGFANLLEARLIRARKDYGDAAKVMSYEPVYVKID